MLVGCLAPTTPLSLQRLRWWSVWLAGYQEETTREEFLKHGGLTEEHGGVIIGIAQKVEPSVTWDRLAFTMDETRSKAVINVFATFYRKVGFIYRGVRMINWGPQGSYRHL